MEKCKLKHCEFAWNGQCCLVCPKGLYRVDPREMQRRKLERAIRMLERVKKKLPNENRYGLPRGIRPLGERYFVTISSNRKTYTLGTFQDLGEAMDVLADALDSRENGDFDEWLADFRAKNGTPKRGRKAAKKGVSKNAEGT